MSITTVLGLISIALIFFVVFIYNKRTAAKVITKSDGTRFETEQAKTGSVKFKKPIDGRKFYKVYKDLKEFIMFDGSKIIALNERNAERKYYHRKKIEVLSAKGITWTPIGLFYSRHVS